MTEPYQQQRLSEDEFAELVTTKIEAFFGGGPYLEAEHRQLARELGYDEEGFGQLWLGAAKRKQEQAAPAPEVFERREFSDEQQARWQAERRSLFLLKVQPAADRQSKNTRGESKNTRTIAAEIIRREFGNAKRKPEEEPEELEPEAPLEEPRPGAEPSRKSPLNGLYLPGVAGEVQSYFLESVMQPSHIMSLGVGLMVPTVLVSGYVFGP